MKKVLLHILFIVGYIVLIAGFNGTLKFEKPADYPQGLVYAKAEVVSVAEQDMGEDPDYNYIRIGKQKLELRIISGEYKGKIIETTNFITRTTQLEGKAGTRYIVGSYDGFITSNIMSYERSSLVVLLVIVFIAMVILFGKRKGVASVAALIVTLLNVVFMFIPMLINGVPAILAAIIVVLLSTFYTMVALNGFCMKSYIATFCCTACTAFAGLLAWLVSLIWGVSTLNTPEIEDLLFVTENTGFRIDNLLTAGILIASMGAVMDTCMSIVSSLFELKAQNLSMTTKQLLQSGMNIGKDIMGTMTNTLILAFAGSSINLVLIYYMYCMPAISLLNTDFIIVEIVKGIISSMAVVLSIPVATFMTSRLIGGNSKIGEKLNNV
ncbi:MAG: YibE/F family protein [Acutalibacteraceae bacterium]|nr:YibE/F family protein [Acutalibacteraceae bacterium]